MRDDFLPEGGMGHPSRAGRRGPLPVSARRFLSCLTLGVALSLLMAGAGCSGKGEGQSSGAAAASTERPGEGQPPQPAIPVAVEAAQEGPIASYYEATATLEPDKQADIPARVQGRILELLVEEGDFVRTGAPLLKIEQSEYRLRLKQAEAEADKQETRFGRLQKLHAQDLAAQEEFDSAQMDLRGAQAARDLASLELSYTTVTAPFSGRITRRLVNVGQTVSEGDNLFSMADLSRLLARVHVPAKEFRSIQLDQPVELALDSNGERLRGRIDLVSPVVDPTSGTIKVTVQVTEIPPSVRPGDFAQVRIVTDRHPQAVLVPKAAVITDKGERVVYVAADSTAERRVVEVGFQDDRSAEILSGIAPGDRVVVQGQRSLKHGQPLKILEKMSFDQTPGGGASS